VEYEQKHEDDRSQSAGESARYTNATKVTNREYQVEIDPNIPHRRLSLLRGPLPLLQIPRLLFKKLSKSSESSWELVNYISYRREFCETLPESKGGRGNWITLGKCITYKRNLDVIDSGLLRHSKRHPTRRLKLVGTMYIYQYCR